MLQSNSNIAILCYQGNTADAWELPAELILIPLNLLTTLASYVAEQL